MQKLFELDFIIFKALNNLIGKNPGGFWDKFFFTLSSLTAYLMGASLFFYWVYFGQLHNEIYKIGLESTVAFVAVRFIWTEGIRHIWPRQRPFKKHPEIRTLIPSVRGFSFPSAHAASMFAITTPILMHDLHWGLYFLSITIVTLISRIIAGVHYPSDILVGAASGVGFGYSVGKTFDHYNIIW